MSTSTVVPSNARPARCGVDRKALAAAGVKLSRTEVSRLKVQEDADAMRRGEKPLPDFLTVALVARLMGLGTRAVHRLIEDRILPARIIPGCNARIPRVAVEKLIADSTHGPAEMFAGLQPTGSLVTA